MLHPGCSLSKAVQLQSTRSASHQQNRRIIFHQSCPPLVLSLPPSQVSLPSNNQSSRHRLVFALLMSPCSVLVRGFWFRFPVMSFWSRRFYMILTDANFEELIDFAALLIDPLDLCFCCCRCCRGLLPRHKALTGCPPVQQTFTPESHLCWLQ